MIDKGVLPLDTIAETTTFSRRSILAQGFRDGIPIGLGYLAVSFSLGISAKNAGLTAFQSFLISAFCNASAGEYAGFTSIGAGASYWELALVTFITNARYLLMSCALSQRMRPGTGLEHRLLMSYGITDELFGIAIAREGYLSPFYSYGAMLAALPCWSVGTALGTVAGELLPLRLVSAFSVALYGMFLAVIIPPAKKNKVVGVLVVLGFLLSWCATVVPGISNLSGGTRTILLTVILSAGAAILFPRTAQEEENRHDA